MDFVTIRYTRKVTSNLVVHALLHVMLTKESDIMASRSRIDVRASRVVARLDLCGVHSVLYMHQTHRGSIFTVVVISKRRNQLCDKQPRMFVIKDVCTKAST